jgi:hypothetical protein
VNQINEFPFEERNLDVTNIVFHTRGRREILNASSDSMTNDVSVVCIFHESIEVTKSLSMPQREKGDHERKRNQRKNNDADEAGSSVFPRRPSVISYVTESIAHG